MERGISCSIVADVYMLLIGESVRALTDREWRFLHADGPYACNSEISCDHRFLLFRHSLCVLPRCRHRSQSKRITSARVESLWERNLVLPVLARIWSRSDRFHLRARLESILCRVDEWARCIMLAHFHRGFRLENSFRLDE